MNGKMLVAGAAAMLALGASASAFDGLWAMNLPYDEFPAGHLVIRSGADGKTEVDMLCRDSSPVRCHVVQIDGNKFRFERRRYRVDGELKGDEMDCTLTFFDDEENTKVAFSGKAFKAKRNPPIDPKASVKDAKFGPAIDLLAEGLDGFESLTDADPEGSWSWDETEKVLSNRLKRTLGGRPIPGVNIKTIREDFTDFRLDCEVRVPAGSNSGLYLRGRYEIQVIDSFGKAPDYHNMGALYGRLTPSVAAERKAGEWQTLSVILYKRHLSVTLNGKTIIDDRPVEGITGGAIDANEFTPGPLYIQGDHSDADYRNMKLFPAIN